MTDLARNPQQIGNLIRRTRKKLGLSQRQLGKKTGLRQETISLIETGNPAAKLETILAVLATLDLEFRIVPRSERRHRRYRGYFLMPRPRRHTPLHVLLNNRLVGHLHKAGSGAIGFQYDQSWLEWDHALPISLSLPLREDTYRGEPVVAVFENLLPDLDDASPARCGKSGSRRD